MNEEALLPGLTDEVKAIKTTLEEAKENDQVLNEAQTEFIIIDPILKRLGYGLLEISKQEHDHVAKSFPDYALSASKTQKWFLEAKKLDLALQDGEAAQAVNYANNQGAEWAVLTNGRKWYIYNAHLPKPLTEKRILQIDDLFSDDKALQILMLLSRPSMLKNSLQEAWIFEQLSSLIDGQLKTPNSEVRRFIRKLGNEAIKAAINDETVGKVLMFATPHANAITVKETIAPLEGTNIEPAELVQRQDIQPTPEINPDNPYHTFDEIAKDITLATYRRPECLLSSNNRSENVETWADVARMVVEYVGQNYSLPPMPFTAGNKGKNYFLNITDTHGNGKQMASYRKVEIGHLTVYVDTNRSTLNICACLLAVLKFA